MRKITFAEYEKKRPFFSNPYYVDCVKRAEERFFNVPAEKIHDAAVELPQNAEGSSLTGPCLVFMSDGTEWGTYCDIAAFYCDTENEWYFSCLPYAAEPLWKSFRREPTVLKWVQLKHIYKKSDFTDKTFRGGDGYYEIV